MEKVVDINKYRREENLSKPIMKFIGEMDQIRSNISSDENKNALNTMQFDIINDVKDMPALLQEAMLNTFIFTLKLEYPPNKLKEL